ncbi:MAG: hypothetical protein ACO20W_06645, partial [Anaerohalosphaeraceae bacterium]
MKKHNEQFENNISRLLKTSRESNRPSEEFTQNLIDEALTELKTDQNRRQKRSNVMKFRRWHPVEIAAGFAICIFMLGLLVNHLGENVQSS